MKKTSFLATLMLFSILSYAQFTDGRMQAYIESTPAKNGIEMLMMNYSDSITVSFSSFEFRKPFSFSAKLSAKRELKYLFLDEQGTDTARIMGVFKENKFSGMYQNLINKKQLIISAGLRADNFISIEGKILSKSLYYQKKTENPLMSFSLNSLTVFENKKPIAVLNAALRNSKPTDSIALLPIDKYLEHSLRSQIEKTENRIAQSDMLLSPSKPILLGMRQYAHCTMNSYRVVSIVEETEIFGGDGASYTQRNGYVYDDWSKKMIAYPDLVEPSFENALLVLLEAEKQKLCDRNPKLALELINPLPKPSSFYLVPHYIVFVYYSGEIAPPAFGVIEFFVSIDDFVKIGAKHPLIVRMQK